MSRKCGSKAPSLGEETFSAVLSLVLFNGKGVTRMSVDCPRVAKPARPADLPQLMAEQADKTPTAQAIVGPGQLLLTYADLRRQVEAVRQTLNSLSIGRGDRVATVLPNGPEAAFAALAITSAATYAPINPAYSTVEF